MAAQSSTQFTWMPLLVFISLAVPLMVLAADPDPLRDFCVADFALSVHSHGFACKNPATANTEDFVFHGLSRRGNTLGQTSGATLNAVATFAFVQQFPGVNTLGLAMARLDFDLGGLIRPHTHPRGSELIFVVEGSLYAGFVDTNNTLFAQVINAGDVMLFPRGLIHFQLNVGKANAMAIVALNSQDAGFQVITNSLFGSKIRNEVLEKTFFLSEGEVEKLKSIFS